MSPRRLMVTWEVGATEIQKKLKIKLLPEVVLLSDVCERDAKQRREMTVQHATLAVPRVAACEPAKKQRQ
jgi:hypothetical protein